MTCPLVPVYGYFIRDRIKVVNLTALDSGIIAIGDDVYTLFLEHYAKKRYMSGAISIVFLFCRSSLCCT